MKFQWKLAIGLLIGMLVIGQVITIRYVVARDRDMFDAQSDARNAATELQQAQATWTTMNDNMKKMMAMPNGPDKEKAIGNMMQQQSDFDRRILTSNVHALSSINHIWAHVDKL